MKKRLKERKLNEEAPERERTESETFERENSLREGERVQNPETARREGNWKKEARERKLRRKRLRESKSRQKSVREGKTRLEVEACRRFLMVGGIEGSDDDTDNAERVAFQENLWPFW